MSHTYVLIIAGGEGVRFRPLSTPERPKQFINIVGDKSLIRQTFERLEPIDRRKIYVATNIRYVDLVRKELPEIPFENIIGETEKKNTAPAIGFAAHVISSIDPEAVMVVLPSDHVILKKNEYLQVLNSAVDLAMKHEFLVTLGMAPTRPATSYGYIERGNPVADAKFAVYHVKQFVEKPDSSLAQQYLSTGRYYWNSGMFVWGARTVISEISAHLSELAGAMDHLPRKPDTADLVNFFERAPNISIDYGIMERSRRGVVIPCSFGWSDIGTWESVKELADSGAVEISSEVRSVMEKQLLKHEA